MRKITLRMGEKYYFKKEDAVAFLECGTVDVYASTMERKQRIFLLKRSEGFLFSLYDEMVPVALCIFACEDAALVLYTEAEVLEKLSDVAFELSLRDSMSKWFRELLRLDFLNYFALRKDEYVAKWENHTFLRDVEHGRLWKSFLEHQSILAMMLAGQLSAERKAYQAQYEKREQKKDALLDFSSRLLLGEEKSEAADVLVKNSQDGLMGLVGMVAKHYRMESVELSVPKYVRHRLKEEFLLKYLLRKANIIYRKVALNKDWQKSDSGVLFVKYRGEIFLAKRVEERYELFGQDASRLPLNREILQDVEQEALLCYPSFCRSKVTVKELVKFVVHYCWQKDFATILFTSFVLGILPLCTPVITEHIFQNVIPLNDYGELAIIAQLLMIAALTTTTIGIVRSIALMRISVGGGIALDAALWQRLLSFPASFFQKYSVGELSKRMESLTVVRMILCEESVLGVLRLLFSFWSLLLMISYSGKLTLCACGIWLVYFVFAFVIYFRKPRLIRESVRADNKNASDVVQIFYGLSKFRTRGAEEQAFYLWSKSFSEVFSKNLQLRYLDNYSAVLHAVVPMLLNMLIYYFAADELLHGTAGAMTIGTFLAFSSAYSFFNASLLEIVPLVVKFIGLDIYMENLRPILEGEAEETADKQEADELSGEIELRHISFAYPGGEEVLHDINLHIRPKENIAIVGPSGCGKTTLVRLLLGFETPTKGSIIYDTQDLSEVNPSSVRRQMGVVLQDGKILPGSIGENILGTNSRLTLEDAWKAAELVGLASDINDMPMGMHTVISNDSGNISGGQRQRILLARAIVHRPEIVILDEATSALDNVTQKRVTDSLSRLLCTRIVVAHRLSTIVDADRILVLKHGEVVEEGTFSQLMEKNGFFAELAKRQLA